MFDRRMFAEMRRAGMAVGVSNSIRHCKGAK